MLKHILLAVSLLVFTFGSSTYAQPTCERCGTWGLAELYSNADGSIQFFLLQSAKYPPSSEPISGLTIVAGNGTTEHSFTFPAGSLDAMPGPILVGTQGFANLNRVKPDFIMPDGFLFVRNGFIKLLGSSWWDRDVLRYPVLPTDGAIALYMDIDGDYTGIARATNNIGQSYAFSPNAPNSFRMTAIFSDQAGFNQYIQLEEKSGLDNQNHFIGLTLEVTSRHGISKAIAFDDDLPESATAGRQVLLGTTHVGLPQVDFMLPPGFLPTDGGTLVFAGADVWDYASLPANGYTVLLRSGATTANPSWAPGRIFQPFAGFPTGLGVLVDPVIEYYNEALDHYFMTSSQPDLDLLDSGRALGWKRTGESFPAWIALQNSPIGFASPPNLQPVCRLYLPEGTRSSHFFSASIDECSDALSRHPDYVQETSSAFFASLPDLQTGECRYDQMPVYRLWNARVDSNHRFTASMAIRDLMKSQGYIAEGYGPNAVAMCVGGGIPTE